jgi:alkylation response protein AidB-like acyl-CoA dehydrogenase
MAGKFVSQRNIKFLLYEVFRADELNRYEYFMDHNQATFDMIIDTALKMGNDMMYPVFQEMDSNPPQYVDGIAKVHPAVKTTMREFGKGGWINASMAYENGGQQIPHILEFMVHYIFTAANYSLVVYPGLTAGAANLILAFGSQELKDRYLDKMFAGEWQGTMALTEPDAGSSLADIKTQAMETDQGHYQIKGKKIFISAGDTDAVENTVHLMLARIKGAPAGVKGLSLFVVPKYRHNDQGKLGFNDLTCDGIEHKLGYKGSPICQLSMGENGDCHGYLVGEANKGLNYMFQMMNEKRVKVGVGAVGKATAAYYAALEYAQQRLQGRREGEKNPLSPQIPIIEHSDIKRMLLFQRAICEGAISLALQVSKYLDLAHVGEEREKHELLADFLIPVVKSYPAEMGILSTSAAIQCLGGYGYCKDFPVEQYYRDIRIDTLHEGTTGIQGKDFLGRKVTMKNGKAYRLFIELISGAIIDAQGNYEVQLFAEKLKQALNNFHDVTEYLLGIKADAERFIADSTLYLEMTGILAVAWQWFLQARVASEALRGNQLERDKDFYNGKLSACTYFFHYQLPKLETLGSIIKNNSGITVTMDVKLFED